MSPCLGLLATSLPLALLRVGVASAQTIVVDGSSTAVNGSTVAPAAEVVVVPSNYSYLPAETVQLTDAVLANLTALQLTNVSIFDFASYSNSSANSKRNSKSCKVFPGDKSWPSSWTWDLLDILLGGALIKAVPIASPCYDNFGNYDATLCEYVADQWTNSSIHAADPTSVMSPLYQGLTCLPEGWGPFGNCTMGGYPEYVVNVTTVAQVQLAVNFARNSNLRLVVKNTGHDFKGRSAGAGALSIWTHGLKSLSFVANFKLGSYSGPVIKVGSGVQGSELYEFADKNNVTAVGGEGRSVGYAGGFIAGGGHSPLSSKYGMAADSIVSVDLVTPDGRFITANEKQNTDLFWALCGGGAGTFGVVTSYTVKVYPQLDPVTISTFSLSTTGNNITSDTFWSAMETYLLMIPTFIDAGNYAYWYLFNTNGEYSLSVMGWVAPGMTTEDWTNLTAPMFDSWTALGIDAAPVTTQHDSFLSAFNEGFPLESVGTNTSRSASRLIPRANFEDAGLWNTTYAAIRNIFDLGGGMVGVMTTGSPANVAAPDNSVNPGWRSANLQVLSAMFWESDATMAEANEALVTFNSTWMPPLRAVAPSAYNSEGNVVEPNWQEVFYGAEQYERLLEVKEKYDPEELFYVLHGVGSENWYVTGQLSNLKTQNGRLCRT